MKTRILKINPNFPEQRLIDEAADVLRKGGLVAFPTETVYGIGANYLDEKAIDRLYEVKKRPKDKPFTIHIADMDLLKRLNITLSEKAKKLIYKFWPGPLTILAMDNKNQKIGLRMPSNRIAMNFILASGMPVAAPSANISGGKPPCSCEEVLREMEGSIDLIIDGGTTDIGIESTVVDTSTEPVKILRQGAIPEKDIVIDYNVLFVCTGNSCRSVMAEAFFKKFANESSMPDKLYADSAGTGGYMGIPAAPNTISVMKEEGIDVAGHKGKILTRDLLKRSDMVCVMEQYHRDFICNMMPELRERINLLWGQDIPDPIGKSMEEYRRVRDIIKDSVENLFLELFNKELKHEDSDRS